MFRWHFKTVADYNYWMLHTKATYPTDALNGLVACILHGVSAEETYEEVTEALQNHYNDHHLEAVFNSTEKDPIRWGIPAGVCRCHQPFGSPRPH
jgi:endonuclease III